MTISFYVECNDCNERYRIRYGLGNNYPQAASFPCAKCECQIEVGYEKLHGERIVTGAKEIDADEDDFKGLQIRNLHPEIPTSAGNEDNPYYFQTMEFFQNWDFGNKSIKDFKELRDRQNNWSMFYERWGEIQTSLRIYVNKGENRLRSIRGLTSTQFAREFENWSSLFLQGEFEKLKQNVRDEYDSIDNADIKSFLSGKARYLKSAYESCACYMNVAKHFQSTYFERVYSLSKDDAVIANINWNEIEQVYGNLYELVGDLFVIPTMINNVKSGRKPQEFKTAGFDLSQYITTDKAGRGINFTENPKLSPLNQSYHPWLRNGTHHKNSTLNTSTHIVTLGVGKGGGAEKEIPVIDYIRHCNELFACSLVLGQIVFNAQS